MAIELLKRIFTSVEVMPSTVCKILKDSMSTIEHNRDYKLKKIAYFQGDHPILNVASGTRGEKYNIKKRLNITKYAVVVKSAIQFNKAISYTSNVTDDSYREDIEVIANSLRNQSEHKINIDTFQDELTCGVGYQFALGHFIPQRGNVKPSYFTIGRLEPENTDCIRSTSFGNPIVLTVNRCTYVDDNGKEQTTFNCFDNVYKYIISKDSDNYYLVSEPIPHNLPFNPISVFENDKYMGSMVEDIQDCNDVIEFAISNYVNDMLIQINQLLAITGAEIDEKTSRMIKNDGVLLLPAGSTAQFLNAVGKSSDVFIDKIVSLTLMLACVPTQSSTRAETGKGVEAQNGHTIASFTCNLNEQSFLQPKREQLDNIITILHDMGAIKSTISGIDIDIQFDQNRLTDISAAVVVLETAIRAGLDDYDALQVAKLLNDPNTARVGMEKVRELKHKFEMELKWGVDYKDPQIDPLHTEIIQNKGGE